MGYYLLVLLRAGNCRRINNQVISIKSIKRSRNQYQNTTTLIPNVDIWKKVTPTLRKWLPAWKSKHWILLWIISNLECFTEKKSSIQGGVNHLWGFFFGIHWKEFVCVWEWKNSNGFLADFVGLINIYCKFLNQHMYTSFSIINSFFPV